MRGWLYPMVRAHPLGETGKRAAERAERAETPCKYPARRIRQRYQSSRRALRQPLCAARHGGNRRKLAETPCKNAARRNCLQFCCLIQGVPIGVTLAETAETAESVT